MKTRHLCICSLLGLATLAAQAQVNIRVGTGRTFRQDTIDHKVLTVQYDMEALTDLGQPDSLMHETMMRHANQYRSQWSEQTYKRYPDGRVTTLDEIAGDISRLRCEEPEEKPQWALTSDTLTLLGYRCTRATAQFKGRQWSAWYAPDIPVSEGPWKLCGLPGLILKAEDAEGHYRFTANGLEQCRGAVPILFGGVDYEPVNRKQYDKVHERFFADPVGFITSTMPNVKITIKDKHGKPTDNPKDTPYNPIER